MPSEDIDFKQLVEEYENLHAEETEYEFSNDREFTRDPYATDRGVYAEE